MVFKNSFPRTLQLQTSKLITLPRKGGEMSPWVSPFPFLGRLSKFIACNRWTKDFTYIYKISKTSGRVMPLRSNTEIKALSRAQHLLPAALLAFAWTLSYFSTINCAGGTVIGYSLPSHPVQNQTILLPSYRLGTGFGNLYQP